MTWIHEELAMSDLSLSERDTLTTYSMCSAGDNNTERANCCLGGKSPAQMCQVENDEEHAE